jgi:hypothetical protein
VSFYTTDKQGLLSENMAFILVVELCKNSALPLDICVCYMCFKTKPRHVPFYTTDKQGLLGDNIASSLLEK